jgi:hypothetical protein
MAAGRETISLSFQAELGDLKRQLGTLPGVTKKEAAAMVKELNTGFKQAERAAAKAAKANKKQFGKMTEDAKAVGAAIVGAAVAVGALTAHFVELSNELTDASARSGVATDTLAGLRLAAKASGQEFATFADALGAFPVKMTEAASGAGNAAIAFDRLKVSATDQNGALRSSEDVLRDLLSALGDVESQEERAALAAYALGEAAGPAFLQSGAIQNLDQYVALATTFGTSVGPEAAAAASDMARQMAILETVSLGQLQQLIASIGGPAGSLNDVLDTATVAVIGLGEIFSAVLATMSETVGMVIDGPLRALVMATNGEPVEALRILRETSDETFEGMLRFRFPAVAMYKGLSRGVENATDKIREFHKQTRDLATPAATPQGLPTSAQDGAGAAAGAGAGVGTSATDKAISDLDRLRQAQRKASEARLSERAKIQLAFEREQDVIFEAMKLAGDSDEVQAAIVVSQTERAIALADLKKRLDDEEMERQEAMAAKALQLNQQIAGSTADALGALASVAGAASAAMAEAGTKGAKKNAVLMFRVSKALALATIPLRIAEGLITAAAQPPPINGIQTATVLAAGAAQGIAVASSKPPTFDRGGIINAGTGDQVAAAVLPGEAILSREAVGNLGRGGVNALNSGGSAGSPVVVQMVYRHRVFDEFVQDNMSAPTPLSNAIRGSRVTGRRG